MSRWLCLALVACSSDPAEPGPGPDAGGTPSIEGTPVASFEQTSCSTGDVLELSRQIADEVNCMLPGQLVVFEASDTIEFAGSAILPYLGAGARTDLYAAADAGSTTMQVTSAFRTVVARRSAPVVAIGGADVRRQQRVIVRSRQRTARRDHPALRSCR